MKQGYVEVIYIFPIFDLCPIPILKEYNISLLFMEWKENIVSFKACGCQLQKGVNVQQVAINKTLGHKKWGRRRNVQSETERAKSSCD